jgi:hypothetical protein
METDAIQEDVSITVDEAAAKILAMDAPEPSDEAESTEEEETEETEVEEPEETAEIADDGEAAEETEETDSEETDQPEDEEVASYLSDLTEHLKEGREYYDQLKVPTKINGVEGEATITELIRDYQTNGNLDQKTDSLTTDRAKFNEEVSTKREEYGQALSNAVSLVNQLEQQLMTSAEKVDWNELRENDPAEFAAKKQEVLEKQQQYQSAKGQLTKEHQTKLTEHFDSVLGRESAALIKEFPGWTDESVAKTEKSAIRDYLLSEGFTALEVDGQMDADGNIIAAGMIDHRAIRMAHKAMQFESGNKKVETAKKRVRKLPKVAKPGKAVTRKDKDSERSKRMKGRLKSSGNVDDAAAIIMDKIFGGS